MPGNVRYSQRQKSISKIHTVAIRGEQKQVGSEHEPVNSAN